MYMYLYIYICIYIYIFIYLCEFFLLIDISFLPKCSKKAQHPEIQPAEAAGAATPSHRRKAEARAEYLKAFELQCFGV